MNAGTSIEPPWKVRIVLHDFTFHCMSWTEPRTIVHEGNQLVGLDWECAGNEGYGDVLGYIDWTAVLAVSWRPNKEAQARTTQNWQDQVPSTDTYGPALELACEFCNAKPGEWCRTSGGYTCAEPHAARRRAGNALR